MNNTSSFENGTASNGGHLFMLMPYPYNPLPFWICLSAETLVTIVGNALLCWTFMASEKLRTGQNYFIISLSVGDMVGGLAVIPCEYCRWKRDGDGCACPFICGSAISFIMAATVISLVLIAYDKYFAVQRPYEYQQKFTKRRALLIILLGWLLSITICVLPLIWEFNPFLNPMVKGMINLGYAVSMFVCTIIAGIFMGIAYCVIVKTVRMKVHQMGCKPINRAGVKVCIICTVVYFTSWLQYCAVEILLQCRVQVSAEVMDASYFVLMLSPCLDCILYAYYRKGFRRCLLAKCKERCASLKSAYHSITSRNGITKQPELVRMCELTTGVGKTACCV